MQKEGSTRRLFSNYYGDLFEIVPFGIAHQFMTESLPEFLAKFIKKDELYPQELNSPPQTPAKSTKDYELSIPRDYSRLGSPQTPLRSTDLYQLRTPHHCSLLSPQTPVTPIRCSQLGALQSSSPLAPSLMTQICSQRELLPELTGFHHNHTPGTQSASKEPPISTLQPTRYRSVSKSPPQTPSRSKNASRGLRPRRPKPSVDKSQSPKSIKTSESQLLGDELQLQKWPRAMEFKNLTAEDSIKINAGVSRSGKSSKRARRTA